MNMNPIEINIYEHTLSRLNNAGKIFATFAPNNNNSAIKNDLSTMNWINIQLSSINAAIETGEVQFPSDVILATTRVLNGLRNYHDEMKQMVNYLFPTNTVYEEDADYNAHEAIKHAANMIDEAETICENINILIDFGKSDPELLQSKHRLGYQMINTILTQSRDFILNRLDPNKEYPGYLLHQVIPIIVEK